MRTICLHDQNVIEAHLRQNPLLHIYEIGDLDDFFWPYTTWYACEEDGQIQEIALLYSGVGQPILLGFSDTLDRMQAFVQSLQPLLPRQLYVHFSPGIEQALTGSYHLTSHGPHYKMALRNPTALNAIDTERVKRLSTADCAEIEEFYRMSYPDNSFDQRMLETDCYYGIREQGQLVSIAGIHVYSPRYRVAAIGNVTTHPDWRGRGLGSAVCAKLSRELCTTVDHIGLNVKADNAGAIACYKRLGFEIIAEYAEFTCTLQR